MDILFKKILLAKGLQHDIVSNFALDIRLLKKNSGFWIFYSIFEIFLNSYVRNSKFSMLHCVVLQGTAFFATHLHKLAWTFQNPRVVIIVHLVGLTSLLS